MRKRIGTEGIEPSLRIKAIALPTELRSKKRGGNKLSPAAWWGST